MGVGGQRHAPAALPPGKTRYSLYRRLDGPQSRSGRVRKISPPPGFDPPAASRYTDYAIPAHGGVVMKVIYLWGVTPCILVHRKYGYVSFIRHLGRLLPNSTASRRGIRQCV
jgi:hypothetical protein